MPQPLPKEGDVIHDRYVIEGTIGQGGFARVFRAWDRERRQPVALKSIVPAMMDVPSIRRRLLREARLAGQLTHPNTVLMLDSGIFGDPDTGLPFLVMEFLSGETLTARLRRTGPMQAGEVAYLLIEILGSLQEAHKKGVIHRDLKPDNIFLVPMPQALRVKVLDFGVAQAFGDGWGDRTMERLTRTGEVSGTVHFMAPDFFTPEMEVTAAVDVYALGCLAHLLLQGQPPYQGVTPTDVALKHMTAPVPRLGAPVPSKLAAIIARSLEKLPEQRFADASEMLDALREAAQHLGGSPIRLSGLPVSQSQGLDSIALSAKTTLEPLPEPGESEEVAFPTSFESRFHDAASTVPQNEETRPRSNKIWIVLGSLFVLVFVVFVVLVGGGVLWWWMR